MTFIVFATIFIALVVICLLWPLLSQQQRPAPAARDKANIEIFALQLDELKQDLENRAITDAQFQQYRLELESQAFVEIDETAETEQPARQSSPYLAVAIALFVPLLSLSIYSRIGSDEFAGAQNPSRTVVSMPQSDAELQTTIAVLERKLAENPDEVEARIALGHVYAETGRYADAAGVYEELMQLRPQQADIMVNYAEALARSLGNQFTGRPAAVLKQALEITPDHARALWLAGIAELQAHNQEQAAIYWRRLLEGMPGDSEIYRQVQEMLAQVEADQPGGTDLQSVPEQTADPENAGTGGS